MLETCFTGSLAGAYTKSADTALAALEQLAPVQARALVRTVVFKEAPGLRHEVAKRAVSILKQAGEVADVDGLVKLFRDCDYCSRDAYEALKALGWRPRVDMDRILAVVLGSDAAMLAELGPDAVPVLVKHLHLAGKCPGSVLVFIASYADPEIVDRSFLGMLLDTRWVNDEDLGAFPEFLSRYPELSTHVLLEKISNLNRHEVALRMAFIEYLAAVGHDHAVPFFISLLESPQDLEVKIAAKTLERLKPEMAVGPLSRSLDLVRDRSTYSAVVRAIAAIGNREAIEVLESIVDQLETKSLRNKCQQTINQFGK